MNKNLISYIIGGVVIIGFIVVMAIASGGSTVNKPKQVDYSPGILSQIESDYDFGAISMADGDVSHSFEFKNEGTEPVVINKVYTSCMCTTAYVVEENGEKHGEYGMPMGGSQTGETDINVLPGESVTLEAVFDPAAHGPEGTGKVKRVVYVETNSQIKPKMEVTFEADVTK